MKKFMVVMSEQCNLNCNYCDMDKKSKKVIDPLKYIAEVKKLYNKYPDDIIKLDFFGGEPLIQFNIIQQVIEEFKNKPNIKFFIPTNGLLLTEDKLAYLKKHNVEISLSFDGLWQDINRLQFNNKGTLHKYKEKRHLFKGLSCHTMIGTGNFNLLENHLFIKNLLGINPDLTLVRDMHTWDNKSIIKLNSGISEIFKWYIQNSEQEMPNFILFYLRHFLLYHSKGVEVNNCGAGIDLFSFSEDQVLPCNRFKNKPEMLKKIPDFYEMSECKKCEVRHYCKKGCLFEQIKNDGPIVELCNVYKHIYKEVSIMASALKNNKIFTNIIVKEIENG